MLTKASVGPHLDNKAERQAQHWRDMHFKVLAAAQLQAAFRDNWIKPTGDVLHGEDYFPALTKGGDQQMKTFISSPKGGSDSMRLMYLTAITATERSIEIEAAYFIPHRGVRIRVLLPGKHIDSETAPIASKRGRGPLLQSEAEIYGFTYTRRPCTIAKMLIFNEYMVPVGLTNFDMRSFELKDEVSLNVYDSTFARQMTGCIRARLEFIGSLHVRTLAEPGLAGEGGGDRSYSRSVSAF